MPDRMPSPSPKAAKRSVVITHPPHTYFHLSLLSSTTILASLAASTMPQEPFDILTARTYLTSALQQYLGLTGTAIPIDFVKIEGRDVWVRLPYEDASAVQGALSQWMGKDGKVSWQVKEKGPWIGSLSMGDGRELFDP